MRFTNLYKIIALFLIILAVFISQFFFQDFFREGLANTNTDADKFYDTYNQGILNMCNTSGVSPSVCTNLLTSITDSCATTLSQDDYKKCAEGKRSDAIKAYMASSTKINQNADQNIPGSSIFSSLASSMDQASKNINNVFSNINPNQNATSIITTSNGQQILATTRNTVDGIPSSQIPQGQEDLYILKSEIVPPICPACPNIIVDDSLMKSKCQPCPACERCPEPAFDCKKVPNYSLGQSNNYLPSPILSDFSQFGI